MSKSLFIHIPKTGGRTVMKYLKTERYGHDIRKPGYKYPRQSDLNQYDFIFAFIRDSFDRVVSAYHYLNQGGNNKWDKADAEKYVNPYPTFEDFIRHGLQKASEEQMHFIPQYRFVGGGDKLHIYRFDQLHEGIADVASCLGVEPPKTISKTNQSNHGDCLDYYTKGIGKIVNKIYYEDYYLYDHIKII